MGDGVEVKIILKDENNKVVTSKGCILRRLNVHLYEVWSEEENTILTLSTDQFEEVVKGK